MKRGTKAARGVIAVALLGGILAVVPSALVGQTIRGRLLNANDARPVPLGLVIMITEEGDTVASGVSRQDGHFELTGSDPAAYYLMASGLGYAHLTAGVFELGKDGVIELEVRLRPAALELDEIIVSLPMRASSPKLIQQGFVERMQRGFGHFITPGDIATSTVTRVTDLFTGIPGARVSTDRGDGQGSTLMLQGMGRFCSPTVYLDGIRVTADGPGDIDVLVSMTELDGIEIFRRPAEVPAQYASMGRTGDERTTAGEFGACGVVLFWTK